MPSFLQTLTSKLTCIVTSLSSTIISLVKKSAPIVALYADEKRLLTSVIRSKSQILKFREVWEIEVIGGRLIERSRSNESWMKDPRLIWMRRRGR